MSQSRTSLDDNEYTTRFNRLGGAINNLAFNIRKDWQTIPAWLEGYVTPDALKTGKQEMTAAGRAIVTKWLVDEIFSRCFHPGLDQGLSRSLKEIEQNIRRFSYKMNSAEEFEALTSKVVSWRMATLEGLSRVLQSPEAAENRADFTRRATTNLTAFLFQHLCDPAPAGVEGSASMIVELAVGIAMNLPLESRDVCIIYPLPGDPVRPEIMDVEKAGLPPLPSVPTGGANKGDDDDEDEDDDESDDDGASAKEDAKGSVKGGGGGKSDWPFFFYFILFYFYMGVRADQCTKKAPTLGRTAAVPESVLPASWPSRSAAARYSSGLLCGRCRENVGGQLSSSREAGV